MLRKLIDTSRESSEEFQDQILNQNMESEINNFDCAGEETSLKLRFVEGKSY